MPLTLHILRLLALFAHISSAWWLLSPWLVMTGSAASATPATPPNRTVNGYLSGVWYTAWHDKLIDMTKINWTQYTTVSYAFAETDNEQMVKLTADDPEGEILRRLVTTAHQADTKVMLTVGGWTGSIWFSHLLGSSDTRSQFVQNVIQLARDFDVDGIEFDWEFPVKQGIGCNTISPDDSSNFLTFLQLLRGNITQQNLPWVVSAAVSDKPFLGPDGNPLTNVTAFAKFLDYVSIMNYDVWTAVDGFLGPNAPLNDTCANATRQQGSATSAVNAWSAAGFPKSQLVLGIPAYGRSAQVEPNDAFDDGHLAVFPAVAQVAQVQGDKWDLPGGTDPCGNTWNSTGIWQWTNLIHNDTGPSGSPWLTPYTSPIDPLTMGPKTAPEIEYYWDECSQTPRVYNSTSQVMLSYDDLNSTRAKADFVKTNGLRGYSLWEAAGDYGAESFLTEMILDTLTSTDP